MYRWACPSKGLSSAVLGTECYILCLMVQLTDCVSISKFQIEFFITNTQTTSIHLWWNLRWKLGKTKGCLSFQLKHIYQFTNIQLILDNRIHQHFIQSLKMDQYLFRPLYEELSTKALLYHTNCNRPDIAFVDTLLAQISATPTIPYRLESNQITTDIEMAQ